MATLPANDTVWYHTTEAARVDTILREGLLPGKPLWFTTKGAAGHDFYNSPVLYFSRERGLYHADDSAILQVSLRGIDVVADIPSLVDFGAYVGTPGDDFEVVYWMHDDVVPPRLRGFVDPDDLLLSRDDLEYDDGCIFACSYVTGTIATHKSIPPDRITVVMK